jgi:hypothetical protein
MLYHEVVELPDHPDIWYNLIDPVDMRGWIALGDFLLNFSTTMDTGYGFDIVVLDSICDRLELQRSTVHGLLMHFADPAKMAFSQIATFIDTANKEKLTEIEVLEIAQSKLREFNRLAARLTPTKASMYDEWHPVLLKRLYSLLHLVIAPRITSFRFGVPLLTAATSEELPQEVKDGIRLNYLFELIQRKRQVPLSRYGTHTASVSLGSTTPPSSPPDEHGNSLPNLDDTERVRSHAIWLVGRNQELCAQVASLQLNKENLQDSKENLQDSNEKLARKVAVLGRVQQPTTYSQPPAEVGSRPHHTSSSDTDDHEQEPNYLQIPSSHNPRHRSLSQDTGPKLATELNQKLHMSNHIRQRSDILTWRYEDVFEPLDSPPSSPLRLSDPATGELLQPMTSSLAAGDGRCSGVAFSADQTELLRDIQDGTPSPPRDSSDGEGDEEEDGLGTPTSSGR